MKSYNDFPPYPKFLTVLKSLPRVTYLYCQLWDSREPITNTLKIKNNRVQRKFFISRTLFRNHISALASLHELIEIEEDEDGFSIRFHV